MAEVSAKTNSVFAQKPGDVIDNFFPAFPVKIRIAAVHAHCKGIQHLKVRLRGRSREIKGAVRVLETHLVVQMSGKRRVQASDQRLVAQIVFFES